MILLLIWQYTVKSIKVRVPTLFCKVSLTTKYSKMLLVPLLHYLLGNDLEMVKRSLGSIVATVKGSKWAPGHISTCFRTLEWKQKCLSCKPCDAMLLSILAVFCHQKTHSFWWFLTPPEPCLFLVRQTAWQWLRCLKAVFWICIGKLNIFSLISYFVDT